MPQTSDRIPGVWQRALGVIRSGRLKRFKGSDISEIERKVTDFYASSAGEPYYENLAGQDLWTDTARRRQFEPLCEAASDILDFGCGAGGLAVALSERFPCKQIHALDIGAHAGELILRRHARVNFQRGSVLEAPCASQSMDMLISRFVIEHVVRPDKLVAEAYRILRPGGVLYLMYPQLLLKVDLATVVREVGSWLLRPARLTYLDPQIADSSNVPDDRDAVWLTNPVSISRLLKRAGFVIMANVPTDSLVIASKPSP